MAKYNFQLQPGDSINVEYNGTTVTLSVHPDAATEEHARVLRIDTPNIINPVIIDKDDTIIADHFVGIPDRVEFITFNREE